MQRHAQILRQRHEVMRGHRLRGIRVERPAMFAAIAAS
jgi:hypothetical protein